MTNIQKARSLLTGPEMARWGWPALVVVLALLAVYGIFTTSRIFYVRDLGAYYWSQFLWVRETLRAGEWPLWDPHVAYGQPAIVDPVRQILFPPAVLLRLAFPDVVGFNLSVALPFPIAGLGAYFFFQRHVSRPAAALAASVFTLSGPILSTSNMLNYSWTIAAMPYVFWCVDRLVERRTGGRFAALALVFGLQALAGEAVTLFFTAVLAVLYAGLGTESGEGSAARVRAALATVGAGVAGALLAAVQLVPLAAALLGSARGEGVVPDGWSIHPLTLVEIVAPHFFGDIYTPVTQLSVWLPPLNSGREPLLMSIYVGVGALLVALFGALVEARRRWALFWIVTLTVTLVLALGYYTPIYGLLRESIPGMQTFRYPSKHFLFTVLSIAALAGIGWDAITARAASEVEERDGRRIAVVAVALAIATLGAIAWGATMVAPDAVRGAFAGLAEKVGAQPLDRAVAYAFDSTVVQGMRLFGLSLAAAGAFWLGTSQASLGRIARVSLFVLVAGDALVTNLALNPTMPVEMLRRPEWTEALREHPTDRVYIGRGERADETLRIDAPPILGVDPDTPLRAIRALQSVMLANMPSGWGVREPISRDMSAMRPLDYLVMSSQFHSPGAGAGRGRYLARTATRYFLLSSAPIGDFRLVRELPNLSPLAVYELTAAKPRVYVAPSAVVEPNVPKHTYLMMSDSFDPYSSVLLAEPPPEPAGEMGTPAAPGAAIVDERASALTVRASAPEGGGYLVLVDSFDPGWRVEVDGREAPVLKANGLFRAVRIAPGEHTVRFVYRPTPLYAGLATSGVTALALVALALWSRRRRG